MTSHTTRLDGLVPDALRPRRRRILLDRLELMVDIGFHDFEIGAPQRLLLTVEVDLDEAAFADGGADDADAAWNYDHLRRDLCALAGARRWNLQETLARAIYDLVAARHGVTALSVATSKPDIYPDCAGVGVSLSSRA